MKLITSSGPSSPFDAIPPEITLQIFTAHLHISLQSACVALYNLSRTCRRWKDIIYGTAELWSVIGFTARPTSHTSLVAAVSTWLKRSRQRPLKVSFNEEGSERLLSVHYGSIVAPILHLLHQEIHRWSDMSFSGCIDFHPLSQSPLFKRRRNGPIASALKSLEINVGGYTLQTISTFLAQLFPQAPKLRTLVWPQCPSQVALPSFIPFTQLSVVKFGNAVSPSTALVMLASMPKLSIFHVNLSDLDSDQAQTPAVADQKAHAVVAVVCHAHELKVGVKRDLKIFASILAPNLRKFELHFLHRQVVPNLEKTPVSGFLNQIASTLSCFTVRNMYMNDADFLCCLKSLSPGLKSLHVLSDRLRPVDYYDVENVTDLVVSALRYDATRVDVLCPKLEVLTLQRCMSATDGLLGEMIASRCMTRRVSSEAENLDSQTLVEGLYFVDVVFRYHSNHQDARVLEGLRSRGLGGQTRRGYR